MTEAEQDLLSHLQNGYQLEIQSLGGDLLLRRLKDNEVIRPLSATRNTVKALQERGLIAQAEGDDPLRIICMFRKQERQKSRAVNELRPISAHAPEDVTQMC